MMIRTDRKTFAELAGQCDEILCRLWIMGRINPNRARRYDWISVRVRWMRDMFAITGDK